MEYISNLLYSLV